MVLFSLVDWVYRTLWLPFDFAVDDWFGRLLNLLGG